MIDVINEGFYNKLNGNAVLTALLSSASAIYFGQAPSDAELPYIVYAHNAGGADHLTPTDSVDMRYVVKGIAATAQAAGAIAGAIRDTLHEQTMSLDSPWTCYRLQEDGAVMYPENQARQQFWHSGFIFRVRATQ